MTKKLTKHQKVAKVFRKIDQTYLKGIKPEQFIKTLESKNIDCVIDIRFWSVYPTYFNPKNMEKLLEIHEIEYKQFQELGNPSSLRKRAKDFRKAKKLYTEYVKTEADDELTTLVNLMRFNKRYCLICYCPTEDPRKCHRFWLIELIMNKYREKLGLDPIFDINNYHRAVLTNKIRKEIYKVKKKEKVLDQWMH
jgi:uncharacterized protein (DUF488 family)